MRVTLAMALLLLPAAALAQSQVPAGPVPVHKCLQTSEGTRCSPVRDGTGFAAADGYTRVQNQNGMITSQQATSVQQGPEGPTKQR